jgi:hypothetical protein
VDAFAAGRLVRTIDPLHSVSYFVPDAAERFGALGMEGRMPYFAARSAPMGAVAAEVVAATFYNFNPELVSTCIPAAWELASPETVTSIRYEIIDVAVTRVLGDDLARSPDLVRAAAILRRAAEAIPNGDGRTLYSAHAALPWPDSAHGQLWHAVTLLREYRGDGHIAALIANGLSGLEALITHTVAGIGFSVEFTRQLRGWSREQWAAGVDRLRDRGLLDEADALTPVGIEMRSRIEDLTDALAFAPWSTLSDDDAEDVARVAKAIREAVQSAKLFPDGAFGPRYGEHR